MATTIVVSTDADDFGQDPATCSLREALKAADDDSAFGGCIAGSGADAIAIGSRTIELTRTGADADQAVGDLDVASNVTIVGETTAGSIIDGGGIDRVLEVHTGTDGIAPIVTIEYLTLRGGDAGPGFPLGQDGGGVLSVGDLTFIHAVVSGNHAGNGRPAVDISIGDPPTPVPTDGGPGGDGGGIYASGAVTLTNSVVTGNAAGNGAGGRNGGGGGAGGSGGGVYAGGLLTVTGTVIASEITHNTAGAGGTRGPDGTVAGGGDGGGFYAAGDATLTNASVAQNVAGRGGGGEAAGAGFGGYGGGGAVLGTLTLTASTVALNSVGGGGSGAPDGQPGDGGGIATDQAYEIVNSTLSGNDGGRAGGGVGAFSPTSETGTIKDSTFADNTAVVFGAVSSSGIDPVASVFVRNVSTGGGSVCTPAGGSGPEYNVSGTDQTDCRGQVSDPGVGPLADNGGLTQTHALTDTSPAVDRVPAGDPACPATDQRQIARPQGFACDAGAFERTAPVGAPTASVALTPDPARTNDILTATAIGADAQGDTVRFEYVWRVDGTTIKTTPFTSSTTDTLDLGMEDVSRGQTVQVVVTPTDGTNVGLTSQDSLVVANSPPSGTVALSPKPTPSGQTLTATLSAADPDGDAVQFDVAWRVNGVLVLDQNPVTGTTSFPSSSLHPGDTVEVAATPREVGLGLIGATVSDSTVVGDLTGPVITITSPTDSGSYDLNATAAFSFSCSDAPSGVASCTGQVDGTGASIASGDPIRTSSAGSHTFTVTAVDESGNQSAKTVHYTINPDAAPPTVAITTPADGASYLVGSTVNASFSCSDAGGSGLASCVGTVGNGSPIDTSTTGSKTFTVSAADNAGNTTSKTFHYTVFADTTPPTVTFTTPADGAIYLLGSTVNASFSCDDTGGSGLASCVGTVGNGSPIDTTTTGSKTFTVTATDHAGNTAPATVHYTVVDDTTPPTVTVTTPADGASYFVGSTVNASYSCADTGGSGLASCVGTVANGSPIDTSTLGSHAFIVDATDGAGNHTTVTRSYMVVRRPTELAARRLSLSTSYTLVATLTSQGTPVAGQTITFSAGGLSLCSATTNADGVARCTVSSKTAVSAINNARSYTARFAMTDTYAGSSDTAVVGAVTKR